MKISVLEPLGIPNQDLVDAIAGALEAAGIQDAEIFTHEDRAEDAESLIARSGDADAVVLSNIPYPAQVMEANPNLKYVCVAFTGFDHVDMEYCRNRGIQVSNCAGYSTSAPRLAWWALSWRERSSALSVLALLACGWPALPRLSVARCMPTAARPNRWRA